MARYSKIAVLDFETDPFQFQRKPEPFAWGYFDGTEYIRYWHKAELCETDPAGCARQLYELLKDKVEIVYAHNGGRFDFFYLMEWLEPQIHLIHSRIMKCYINKCELRDSYLILPLPLSAHKKDEIDYDIFEMEVRDLPENKAKIEAYLESDCRYLYDWVKKFTDRFGKKITLPSACFSELKKTNYPLIHTTESYDEYFRKYYYGGRTQVFRGGEHIDGGYKYYDVNSMYPFAMLAQHPVGLAVEELSELPSDGGCYFARIRAISKGALPFNTPDSGLQFSTESIVNEYFTTGWEIQAGLETGTLEIVEVLEVWKHERTANFEEYVYKFHKEKNEAKKNGDKDTETFSKLLLNACYGRFGINPREFMEYQITELGELPDDCENSPDFNGWEIVADLPTDKTIWQRPDPGETYINVAVAASITGLARSILWRAICNATDVLYCDTDSLICRDLKGVTIGNELGNWKLEGQNIKAWIGGRKLYALHGDFIDKKGEFKKEWKHASKGARLKPEDIVKLVQTGKALQWQNIAPSFSLRYGPRFIEREINLTF